MNLPNDTPSTRPGVLRPIAATSVQQSMPPDLKIPSVNCTRGSETFLAPAEVGHLIFFSTCAHQATNLHHGDVDKSKLAKSPFQPPIYRKWHHLCPNYKRIPYEPLSGRPVSDRRSRRNFLGAIHSMRLQMIDLVSLDIRNHTWILSPVAARGIRNPSVRSWVL